MSLVVSCQCGQSFAASPDLAGQTLPCPACSRPLTVAGPSSAPVAPAPLPSTPFNPAYPSAGYSAAPSAPGFGAPPGFGAAPGFSAPLPGPGYGQPTYGAPHMADPYAMAGYGMPAYGMPAGEAFQTGGDVRASTTVKALIGVAIGVVVLLVCAIIGEKIYSSRSRAPRPVAAATPAASDPSKPKASVPAPVGSVVPKPAPAPASTPVSIPAPAVSAPPGTQPYTVPGKFTIYAPPAYSWIAQPQQTVGRGVTTNAYIARSTDGSGLTVSIVNSPIKAQKDRRDFLRGASGGLSRGAAGMTLVNSEGFSPVGTVPDRLDIQLTLQGFNGVQVHGKGFITFGKKRTCMVLVMAQDVSVRDSLMQSVNSFQEL